MYKEIINEDLIVIAHSLGNPIFIKYICKNNLNVGLYISLAGFAETFCVEGKDVLNKVIEPLTINSEEKIKNVNLINEITYSCLDNLMKINSIAPMFLTSQLIELIKENEADILNVGYTIGLKQGYENQLAYTTSKWALRGTSYNLQLEFKKYNCRVIQLNVGGMNTKMHEKYTGKKIENPDEWMNPKDIAGLMLYTLNLPKKIEISEITVNRKNS